MLTSVDLKELTYLLMGVMDQEREVEHRGTEGTKPSG